MQIKLNYFLPLIGHRQTMGIRKEKLGIVKELWRKKEVR
jgi:hypothetical protein